MVYTLSFSQLCLCIQPSLPSLQSSPKIRSPTSAILDLPISSLLVHKIILTTPTNTPFLYTSAVFLPPIFAYGHPYNLHQKYFPYLSHLANSGMLKGPPVSKGVLWGLTLFWSLSLLTQSIEKDNRAHNHWFLIAKSLWWRCLQSEWKTIQSIFFFTLNLLSLIPYPTNIITRTQIPFIYYSYPSPPICLEVLPSYHRI